MTKKKVYYQLPVTEILWRNADTEFTQFPFEGILIVLEKAT